MTRRRQDPLRPLADEEGEVLERISRAQNEPAVHVARAKSLLAVADGATYEAAARAAGRRSNDAVSQLAARFNKDGLAALEMRHGGGPEVIYGVEERKRILAAFERTPDREQDGTATWSLTTLQRALRDAPDGLPNVSTYTVWRVLHDAGWTWQKDRTWCKTGTVQRNGTAKTLTLFHPATGQVRVTGVTGCTNAVLHAWLKQEWSDILAKLPLPIALDAETNRAVWELWRVGLGNPLPLPDELPPLRALLVWDNLAGHKTPEMVEWLIQNGVMPLYTPLGGS
jgi:transposase